MRIFLALKNYILGAIEELKRVSWPKKDEAVNYIIIVIASIVISVLAVAMIDWGLAKLMDFVLR